MPVTVVVGGQFGSEGKGKVAHWLAKGMGPAAVVRVGGSNSGHTVVGEDGATVVFRHLPTAALLPDPVCVIARGSYVDVDILLKEVEIARLPLHRLVIDPHAVVVTEEDRQREKAAGLRETIGSTLTGTGSAVQRRVARDGTIAIAAKDRRLQPYVRPVATWLRRLLDNRERVLIEGTQGFGLSLIHGVDYPKVTSRDTTAAGFVAETGLSPLDVDDIVMVLRTFPIRVPGNSGLLPREVDWPTVTLESGSDTPIVEYTSVTQRVRRVARFDAEVVRMAIATNQPTRIVLNHLDYIDWRTRTTGCLTERAVVFITKVCSEIGRPIDYWGISPSHIVDGRAGTSGEGHMVSRVVTTAKAGLAVAGSEPLQSAARG